MGVNFNDIIISEGLLGVREGRRAINETQSDMKLAEMAQQEESKHTHISERVEEAKKKAEDKLRSDILLKVRLYLIEPPLRLMREQHVQPVEREEPQLM